MQLAHIRWGSRKAPHLGQVTRPGVSSFQWELRRLSRRALDTFLLGTAMGDTSFKRAGEGTFHYSLSFLIQQLRKGCQSGIDVRFTPAGAEVQIGSALGAQPFAVV